MGAGNSTGLSCPSLVLCMLISMKCAASSQEDNAGPLRMSLDRTIGRFCTPAPYHQGWRLGNVFGHFVKQARVRVSLEYEFRFPELALMPQVPVLRIENGTARQVQEALFRAYSVRRPLLRLETDEHLSVVEKGLLDDPAWPLNMTGVPGFQVRGVSFEEVCGRAVKEVAAAAGRSPASDGGWEVLLAERLPGANFVRSGGEWKGPITADIRGGTVRDVLWQVAALQPNCFWGAQAVKEFYDKKRGTWGYRGCRIAFASWGDRNGLSARELVARLLRCRARDTLQSEDRDTAEDTIAELRTRGMEGLRAVIEQFEEADVETKAWLLTEMGELCGWPDTRAAIRELARAERSKRPLDSHVAWALDLLDSSIAGADGDDASAKHIWASDEPHAGKRPPGARWLHVILVAGFVAMVGALVVVVLKRRVIGKWNR